MTAEKECLVQRQLQALQDAREERAEHPQQQDQQPLRDLLTKVGCVVLSGHAPGSALTNVLGEKPLACECGGTKFTVTREVNGGRGHYYEVRIKGGDEGDEVVYPRDDDALRLFVNNLKI